ncbi:hypothetical protein BC831DRAFT_470815, partial [Entophlyctis helioformis]
MDVQVMVTTGGTTLKDDILRLGQVGTLPCFPPAGGALPTIQLLLVNRSGTSHYRQLALLL